MKPGPEQMETARQARMAGLVMAGTMVLCLGRRLSAARWGGHPGSRCWSI